MLKDMNSVRATMSLEVDFLPESPETYFTLHFDFSFVIAKAEDQLIPSRTSDVHRL